jgi:hypothetical protein
MSRYELQIECKACREGRHAQCSETTADLKYQCIVVRRMCKRCKADASR